MHTEITFTLPRGYVDRDGGVHREGRMRLATARDELEPLRDPLARRSDAHLSVLVLSRVITRLGTVAAVDRDVVEGLFAADFDHLQKLYERVNGDPDAVGTVTCPHCDEPFEVDLTDVQDGRLGE